MKNKMNFITKSFLIKTFAVLMIVGMMDSQAFSQTRIRFAKGRSATTINGTLSGGSFRTYIAGAKRGQQMIVRIDSKASFDVEVDGLSLFEGGTVDLEKSGDHKIIIHNDGNRSATYSLYVSIK